MNRIFKILFQLKIALVRNEIIKYYLKYLEYFVILYSRIEILQKYNYFVVVKCMSTYSV